ncbi:ThiF family adenylyltransferase [Persephonella sp. KM09-Lau-8]|uniref:ThiF family adenylyltransferase n=1 Tax=Persephonella sp. KM09-Lau-8 TaxID=1158345 RepID=UPI0005634280|nr:ThiF family adenylyltransferase [Persephonella sp. KM09-Lau-8]
MKFFMPEKPSYKITLIGCGGTGGYIAQALSRIAFESEKEINLIFIDGDAVEEKNVGRQNFYYAEIGENKASVLAERFSFAYGIDIEVVPKFLNSTEYQFLKILSLSDIIISAVDSAAARKEIHECLEAIHTTIKNRIERNLPIDDLGYMIWIDSGNNESSGQILIGNSFDEKIIKMQKNKESLSFLPYPSISEPDIINKKKEKKHSPRISCAERIALKEQSTTINLLMASVVSSMVNSLVEGKGIESYKVFVNEEIPGVFPVYVSEALKNKS